MGHNTSRSYHFQALSHLLTHPLTHPLTLALTLCLLSLTHCNSQTPPSLVGTYPFQINTHDTDTHDTSTIEELTFTKSDPTTDDHWFALIQKNRGFWNITRTSQAIPLIDTEADEVLINHLLDTLKNTYISSLAPHAALETLGLAPPRFSLRWSTPKQTIELFIGILDPKNSLTYMTLNLNQMNQQIYLGSGALFQIVQVIDSFQALRKLTWSRQRPDPMEALQLSYRHQLILSAERNGDDWVQVKQKNSGKKVLHLNLDAALTKILSTRALQLIDDPVSANQIQTQVKKNATYELKLTDIHGKTFHYQLWQNKKVVYGILSERPNAVFQLPDQVLKHFRSIVTAT